MNFRNIAIFDTPDLLAFELAKKIIELINCKNGDSFHLALSGGSTPKLLFKELSLLCKNESLQNLHVWWSDERCVPQNNDESNYKWAKQLWLANASINSENIHKINGELDPKVEVQCYSNEIIKYVKSTNQIPSFDLILLGLGNDGHVASIFPGFEDINTQMFCFKATHPTTNQSRISFTLPLINNAKHIFVVVTGIEKSGVIADLFTQNEASKQYPASYLRNDMETTTWYLDAAALSEVTSN